MNELARPTLTVDLDVSIPEIPSLPHNLDVVEAFSNELKTFYNDLLDTNSLSVKEIKGERTKVRKIISTIADNRKKTVNAYKEPIKDFEDTSKRIEKTLKELDDRMKSIVDESKALLEDPFAGLTATTKIVRLIIDDSQLDLVKQFAKENKIEMEIL